MNQHFQGTYREPGSELGNGNRKKTLNQLPDLRDVAISGRDEGIWGDVERQPWFITVVTWVTGRELTMEVVILRP